MPLSKKQNSYLRGKAHALHYTVTVGGSGLTDAVLSEIENTLSHHELIKIKISSENRDIRDAVSREICQQTDAEYIQQIGKMLIIYRPGEKQKITLPA